MVHVAGLLVTQHPDSQVSFVAQSMAFVHVPWSAKQSAGAGAMHSGGGSDRGAVQPLAPGTYELSEHFVAGSCPGS